MKIAILSLILNTNYGGILQSYALQTILERMGHNVKVLDHEFVTDLPLRQLVKVLPKRFINKYIFRNNITLYTPQYYQRKQYRERSTHTRSFIFKNIHIRKCKSLKRLRNNEFDAIVVGSDQVWRPSYFICWGDFLDSFLLFAKGWDIRRISYAASFGTDKWMFNSSDTIKIRELIHLFDAVSVREMDGINICKDNLGIETTLVLDPTLLLSKTDYVKLIESASSTADIPKSSLLNYILDDNKQKNKLVDNIAKEKKLITFRINESEDIRSNVKRQPVETWLKAFYNSDFIVTDSYHACVFSIIFEKPFICFVNEQRGISRFRTLSSIFGLSRHFITHLDEYDSSFDYRPTPVIKKRIESLQTISINFLRKNLQDGHS